MQNQLCGFLYKTLYATRTGDSGAIPILNGQRHQCVD